MVPLVQKMLRFNGNIENHDTRLIDLLSAILQPFHFILNKEEKENMLVIGPGGGKEILSGNFLAMYRILPGLK